MRSASQRIFAVTSAVLGLAIFGPGGAVSASGDVAPIGLSSRYDYPAQTDGRGNRSLAARVEVRITDLHVKLEISPPQEPQWQKFAQTMRDNARKMDEAFQSRVQLMPSMTAAENMRSCARLSMLHAQDLEHLIPAFEALYGTMSETQKRIADQVFRDDAGRDEQDYPG